MWSFGNVHYWPDGYGPFNQRSFHSILQGTWSVQGSTHTGEQAVGHATGIGSYKLYVFLRFVLFILRFVIYV